MHGAPRNTTTAVAFLIALLITVSIDWLAYGNLNSLHAADAWENHCYEIIQHYGALLTALDDAETGHRGFVITGKEVFLDPYNSALTTTPRELSYLRQNSGHDQRLPELERLTELKLAFIRDSAEFKIEVACGSDSDRGR